MILKLAGVHSANPSKPPSRAFLTAVHSYLTMCSIRVIQPREPNAHIDPHRSATREERTAATSFRREFLEIYCRTPMVRIVFIVTHVIDLLRACFNQSDPLRAFLSSIRNNRNPVDTCSIRSMITPVEKNKSRK